jgi:hypothetical protein
MEIYPFSALLLFAQSCLTDAVNVIFSDYCFTDTYLNCGAAFHENHGCFGLRLREKYVILLP